MLASFCHSVNRGTSALLTFDTRIATFATVQPGSSRCSAFIANQSQNLGLAIVIDAQPHLDGNGDAAFAA